MAGKPRVIVEAPSVLGLFPKGVETLPDALLAAGLAEQLDARRAGRVLPPPYDAQRDPVTLLLNPQGLADYAVALADTVGAVVACRPSGRSERVIFFTFPRLRGKVARSAGRGVLQQKWCSPSNVDTVAAPPSALSGTFPRKRGKVKNHKRSARQESHYSAARRSPSARQARHSASACSMVMNMAPCSSSFRIRRSSIIMRWPRPMTCGWNV